MITKQIHFNCSWKKILILPLFDLLRRLSNYNNLGFVITDKSVLFRHSFFFELRHNCQQRSVFFRFQIALHFPRLQVTFLQLCVVAAHSHFPTSYQRAKIVFFSNEGNAAITQNCPLWAVAAFRLHCPTMVYFWSSPNDFLGTSVRQIENIILLQIALSCPFYGNTGKVTFFLLPFCTFQSSIS